MLIISIFSFSQNVSKSPVRQGRLNSGLCGKPFWQNAEQIIGSDRLNDAGVTPYIEMIHKNEPCSMEKEFYDFARSLDPCQPARTAQADKGRDFSGENGWLFPFI